VFCHCCRVWFVGDDGGNDDKYAVTVIDYCNNDCGDDDIRMMIMMMIVIFEWNLKLLLFGLVAY